MKHIIKYYHSCHEKPHSSFFAGNILCGTPSMTPILQQNCPQILVCPGYNILFPMINTAIEYDTNSWYTNVCIFIYIERYPLTRDVHGGLLSYE